MFMKKAFFLIGLFWAGFLNAYYMPFAESYVADEETGLLLYTCGSATGGDSTAIHKDDARFADWASGWKNLVYGANCEEEWRNPQNAMGKASDSVYDIVCLGDGGSITLTFDYPIFDGDGFDFAVFENSFDDYCLELAFVEVSSDGAHFVRFPNLYLESKPIGAFAKNNPRYIYNLASKYSCGYGHPFDLSELKSAYEFALSNGCTFSEEYKNSLLENYPHLDFSNVRYVRIIDIIGDGKTLDSEGQGIYDPVGCVASAGFDLNAVGVINSKKNSALKTQTILFTPISDRRLTGISPILLEASASSNLPVSFELAQGSGKIENGYYVPAEGVSERVIIKAVQSGNTVYAFASAYVSFLISDKSFQEIVFPKIADLPAPVASPKLITLKASASSGLKVSYDLSKGQGSVMSSNILRLTDTSAPQIIEVKASQGGDANYMEAKTILRTFAIYNPVAFNSSNPLSDANSNGYCDIFEYAFSQPYSGQNDAGFYPQIEALGTRARVSWRICVDSDEVEITPKYKLNDGGETVPEYSLDYEYIEDGKIYRAYHYDVDAAYGDEVGAYFTGVLKSGETADSPVMSLRLEYSFEDWAAANSLKDADASETAAPFGDSISNLQKYAFGLNGSGSASFSENKHFNVKIENGCPSFSFSVAKYALDYLDATPLWSSDMVNWQSGDLLLETSDDGNFKVYKVRHLNSQINPIFFKAVLRKK